MARGALSILDLWACACVYLRFETNYVAAHSAHILWRNISASCALLRHTLSTEVKQAGHSTVWVQLVCGIGCSRTPAVRHLAHWSPLSSKSPRARACATACWVLSDGMRRAGSAANAGPSGKRPPRFESKVVDGLVADAGGSIGTSALLVAPSELIEALERRTPVVQVHASQLRNFY